MKRNLAITAAVIILTLSLLVGASLAGARYLRSAAWAGDIGEPVTFVEINRVRLE